MKNPLKNVFRRKTEARQAVHQESGEIYTLRHYTDAANLVPLEYTVPNSLGDKEETIRQDCEAFLKSAGYDRFSFSYYSSELESLRALALASLDAQRVDRIHMLRAIRKRWEEAAIYLEDAYTRTKRDLQAAENRLAVLMRIYQVGTAFEETHHAMKEEHYHE